MNILGISCNYHDAAACIVRDGKPLAAAEEERFTRRKHDARFPENAIEYCLKFAGLSASSLDGIAFYEKPGRKLERLLRIGKAYMPLSAANVAAQFSSVITSGIKVEEIIRSKLGYDKAIYFSEHHLSHAASAYYVSPFDNATVLTVDGVGEWAACGHFSGQGSSLKKCREINYPHSLGMLYSTITSYLGFQANDDEYKVMGLASYGAPRLKDKIGQLITLHGDGSFALNLKYFSFMYSDSSMYNQELEDLLGPARSPVAPIETRHRDIAASLQTVIEDALVSLAISCRMKDGAGNLCMAGGVAQNCVANSRIQERSGFKRIFIQPAPGDSGAAMGAALWASHEILHTPRTPEAHDTLLGPNFTEEEILAELRTRSLFFERVTEDELCARVSRLILDDFIIGWFQGRMEFGPRALGNRSILANPRSKDMKETLNIRIKWRETFRPFAPAVLEEAASSYFVLSEKSPFMLLTPKVRDNKTKEIPAVTHIDGTARVQTVSSSQYPLFHKLIKKFGELSGTPILINTSFNVRGEPIVCTPRDAFNCFESTDIDFLAIGPFIVSKVWR